jgi:hypothetical protein
MSLFDSFNPRIKYALLPAQVVSRACCSRSSGGWRQPQQSERAHLPTVSYANCFDRAISPVAASSYSLSVRSLRRRTRRSEMQSLSFPTANICARSWPASCVLPSAGRQRDFSAVTSLRNSLGGRAHFHSSLTFGGNRLDLADRFASRRLVSDFIRLLRMRRRSTRGQEADARLRHKSIHMFTFVHCA